MWKSKKFKIIASLLIISTVLLIVAPSDLKNGIKNLFKQYVVESILSDKSNEATELGKLQNLLYDNKAKALSALKEENVDYAKELLSEIVSAIEEKDKEIGEEFEKAEEIVADIDYSDAYDRLNETKNSYNTILNAKDKIKDTIEENDISKYEELLNDKSVFGEEIDKETLLSDSLPNNVKNVEPQVEEEKAENSAQAYEISNDISDKDEFLKTTIDTEISEEIKAKGKEIGDDPLDLYSYVRNNISYQPYYGSRKGSIGALNELSGNDYDQSSLLIALFRNADIPSRYVKGEIELSPENAMAWTATDSVESAAKILGAAGNKVTSIVSGGKIVAVKVEHVWVEAYISTGEYRGLGEDIGEKAWIPFDPSYKESKKVKGMDVLSLGNVTKEEMEKVKISSEKTEDGYGNSKVDISEFTEMYSKYNVNLKNNFDEEDFVGKRAVDVFGGIDIVKEEIDMLPYSIPNNLIKISDRFSEIKEEDRDYVSVNLSDSIGNGKVALRKSGPELYGKKYTISFKPATEKDEEIINKYGDIFKTPAYLISVKPVLMIDGKEEAVGTSIGFGKDINCDINMERAALSNDNIHNSLVAGGYYAIGLDYGAISPSELEAIQDRLETAKSKTKKLGFYNEEVGGEILNALVKNYFSQVDGNNAILANEMNIRNTRALSVGLTGTSLKTAKLLNNPVDVKLDSIYVDIDNDSHVVVSETGESENEKLYTAISGTVASNLENSIIEQATGMESVSTIRIFEIAEENKIPIYDINKENVNNVLPLLSVSNSTKNEIINAINNGKTVTIPEREINYYDWVGTGYIVSDPDTGAAGYMISGGYAGGSGAMSLADVDWGEVALAFVDGLIEGLLTGIVFGLINVALMALVPAYAGIIMAVLAIIFVTMLICSIIEIVMMYGEGIIDLQDLLNEIARMVGMMIGAILGGKAVEKLNISSLIEGKLRAKINSKYNISKDVGEAIYKKGGARGYNEYAKHANELSKLGLKDADIIKAINDVPKNIQGEYLTGLKDHFSRNGNNGLGDTAWVDGKGNTIWPSNDGFLGPRTPETLQPGTIVDRYGYDGGSYVSPANTPYTNRALAPGTNTKPYSKFIVKKPIDVQSGKIAPWFGEKGGGIQYFLPETVKALLDGGYLERVD